MFQLDAFELSSEHTIRKQGDDAVRPEKPQGTVERAGAGDDETDDKRRDDAGHVANAVEYAAAQPGHLSRRDVCDHCPADGAQSLAEKRQRHDEHHSGVGMHKRRGHNGRGERHAEHERCLPCR